jgi:threonine dehydrogenase-like Zn-dependent dehydrogenase
MPAPAARLRKLMLRVFTGTVRSATAIVDAPPGAPGPGQVLIRNHYAGVNGVFDQHLCRNRVRSVNVVAPFHLGVETVGEVVALGPGVVALRVGDGPRSSAPPTATSSSRMRAARSRSASRAPRSSRRSPPACPRSSGSSRSAR